MNKLLLDCSPLRITMGNFLHLFNSNYFSVIVNECVSLAMSYATFQFSMTSEISLWRLKRCTRDIFLKTCSLNEIAYESEIQRSLCSFLKARSEPIIINAAPFIICEYRRYHMRVLMTFPLYLGSEKIFKSNTYDPLYARILNRVCARLSIQNKSLIKPSKSNTCHDCRECCTH